MTYKEKVEQIRAMLRKAASNVAGSRVRVTLNNDQTIDGEIWAPIGHGETIEDKLEAMQDTLRDERIGNTHTAVGFRFEPSARIPEKNTYNVYRGMYQVFSNYYRNSPEAIAVVGDIIEGRWEEGKKLKGMRDHGYRKPIIAIVRVHWSKHGIKPPREEGK